MRILLVQPPITLKVAERLKPFLHLEPLALEIVAGGIPEPHEIRLLDLSCERDWNTAFRRVFEKYRPGLLGFTGYSNQAASIKRLAATAKRILPSTITIAGGVHATLVPEDLRLPGVIDVVVRGEGGVAMRTLMPILESGGRIPANNVFLPTNSDQFTALAKSPLPELPHYSEVPLPRRDLARREDYYCIWHGGPNERMPTLFPRTASMRTSTGCPHRCSFCVVPHLATGKYRRRQPEAVVDEIASLAEDHIYFVDDEMFIDTQRAEAIARLLIAKGIRKKYISWARADTIVHNPDLFALWKDAGLSLVYVGLESMDSTMLEQYHKGINPEENMQAVNTLRSLGIGLHAALMIQASFSSADFDRLEATVEAVLPAEISFTVFSPPPGTPLWKESQHRFICPDAHAFYDCMHTLLPTTLTLRQFYRNWALLLLISFRGNPWRRNRVRVPLKDLIRLLVQGMRYGLAIRDTYKDYTRFPGMNIQ